MDAIFRHGDPVMVDYTPTTGNVATGQVVVVGAVGAAFPGVCHEAIVNNALGAISAGNGVYELTNLNNAANGSKVWWDNTNKKITTASTNNAVFGFVVNGGGGGANSVCRVMHAPYQ